MNVKNVVWIIAAVGAGLLAGATAFGDDGSVTVAAVISAGYVALRTALVEYSERGGKLPDWLRTFARVSIVLLLLGVCSSCQLTLSRADDGGWHSTVTIDEAAAVRMLDEAMSRYEEYQDADTDDGRERREQAREEILFWRERLSDMVGDNRRAVR